MSLDNVKSFCVIGETDEIDGVRKVVQKANVTKLTMFLIELNVLLIRPCFLLDCYVLCIGMCLWVGSTLLKGIYFFGLDSFSC